MKTNDVPSSLASRANDQGSQLDCAPQPLTVQTQTVVTNLLKEVLDLPQVDLERHFVDLGGDSLAATRLVAGLSDAFATDFSPILPFESNTLKDLVVRIDAMIQSVRKRDTHKLGDRTRGVIGPSSS